ncbi:MAG: hypothetical protein ABW034_09820 [Steroidobacteraceae bacterium]
MIDEACSLDVRAIHLEVHTANDSAVRLYAALDFRARDDLMTKTL